MVICVRKQNNIKYKPQYKTVRDYSKYDHTKLINDLNSFDWEAPSTPNVPSETRASRFAEYYSEVVLSLKTQVSG